MTIQDYLSMDNNNKGEFYPKYCHFHRVINLQKMRILFDERSLN